MRADLAHRFQVAHDAVLAVDVVEELVGLAREALLDLAAGPADHPVDVADRVRVADADDADEPLADLARALQLDLRAAHGRDEHLTGDTGGLLVDLLVAAAGHVERAAGEVLVEGVGPLVHGVPGDRGDRAALLRVHGGDRDVVVRDRADDGFLGHVGLGAERGALEHLAEVVGVVLGKALVEGGRGEDGGVAAAAADDDVGPALQRLDERVHAGHGDDPIRAVQLFRGERRSAVQTLDHVAALHPAAQVLPVQLGVEGHQLEGLETVLAAEVADHTDVHVDAAVGAGVARGADHHRHPLLARGEQHQLEVVLLPVVGADARVAAERPRPDVVAARVAAVVVGPGLGPDPEAALLGRGETHVPVGADDAQGCLLHRVPPLVFTRKHRRALKRRAARRSRPSGSTRVRLRSPPSRPA